MEDSMHSISNSLCSKTRIIDEDDNQEESGWTIYFEDFLANNNNNKELNNNSFNESFSSSCYDYYSTSLVSDAASSVAKKFIDNAKAGSFLPFEKTCKKLSFKKRNTKGGLVLDDSLEDTASSPVHSPKLLEMKQKEKDNIGICEKKESGAGQTDEKSGVGFVGRDSDCTELKKRGLCLVPLSMLNYFG